MSLHALYRVVVVTKYKAKPSPTLQRITKGRPKWAIFRLTHAVLEKGEVLTFRQGSCRLAVGKECMNMAHGVFRGTPAAEKNQTG